MVSCLVLTNNILVFVCLFSLYFIQILLQADHIQSPAIKS